MLSWLSATFLGLALAYVQYRLGGAARSEVPRALRALAYTLVLLLLFDAPLGPSRAPRPYAALDVSASWLASGDSTLWKRAVRSVDSLASDTLLLLGDSVRAGAVPTSPVDGATRLGPLVERTLGAGRAVTLVTDGRMDDAERLSELPAGSRVVVLDGRARTDAAVVSLDGPSTVVAGDTAEFSVVVGAAGAGAPAGKLEITLGGSLLTAIDIEALAPWAEREVRVRSAVTGVSGPRVLRAVVTVPGDVMARNDTLVAVLDVAKGAAAVFASTSPDFDGRYALDVLRGTLAVPTRGYFRVAPGQWRVDGALTPVTEDEVRTALKEAPLAVIHGDTALFGPPRTLTRGSLALLAPPSARGDDFYATAAPPSPLAAALGALPWDSLPPVELGDAGRGADWVAVTARRGRRFDERALVSGSSRPRRTVVVPVAGLWRWRFRGGRSADAFTALWGSVFDWLTGDAVDARAAHPASAWIRSGEPLRWRRGTNRDSVATVVVRARGAARADTLRLRFAGDGGVAFSPSLPPGLYETHTGGGDGLIAVNVSSEWVPRRASVTSGAVGRSPAADRAPRARAAWWLYALALAALCGEWLLRRRIGLR